MSVTHDQIGFHQGSILLLEVNFQVSKLFKAVDFEQVTEYERFREKGFFGFAGFYINRFNITLTSHEKIDIEIYQQLAKLDARLGTKVSNQLMECLSWTTRADIIEVRT